MMKENEKTMNPKCAQEASLKRSSKIRYYIVNELLEIHLAKNINFKVV